MKKQILFLSITCLILSSCVKSNEDKADDLMKKYVATTLIEPDSYEKVITRIDSCDVPYGNPEFHQQLKEWGKILREIEMINDRLKFSFSRTEKYNQEKDQLEKEEQDIFKTILSQTTDTPEFSGYIVSHRYRYIDNNGIKNMKDIYAFVNKDFTEITCVYDTYDFQEIYDLFTKFNYCCPIKLF